MRIRLLAYRDLALTRTGDWGENPAFERRTALRLTPSDDPTIVEATIGNSRVFLVNFSNAGMLIETSKPPRISTSVRLKLALVNRGITPVRATVVRCAIASLSRSTIWYRAGLEFDKALELHVAAEPTMATSKTDDPSPGLGAPLTGDGTAMCEMCGQPNPARWMYLMRGRELCSVCAAAAYGGTLDGIAS